MGPWPPHLGLGLLVWSTHPAYRKARACLIQPPAVYTEPVLPTLPQGWGRQETETAAHLSFVSHPPGILLFLGPFFWASLLAESVSPWHHDPVVWKCCTSLPVCPSSPAPQTLSSLLLSSLNVTFPSGLGYFSYWADLGSVTSVDKHLKVQIASILKTKQTQNKTPFTTNYCSIFYPFDLLQAKLFKLFFLSFVLNPIQSGLAFYCGSNFLNGDSNNT